MFNYLFISSTLKGFRLRVWDHIIILLILLIASKFWLFLSSNQIIELIVTLLAFNLFGKFFLLASKVLNSYSPFLLTGFSILIGGILISFCFILFAFLGLPFVWLKYFVLFVGFLSLLQKLDFNFDKIGILSALPFLMFLFNIDEREIPSKLIFIDLVADSFYYTAITKSLSVDWTIFSSVYHVGIPYNYQVFTYFFPATFITLFDLPSHFALWGVFVPLVKVFSFGSVSFTVCNFVFNNSNLKIERINVFQFITSLSLVGLAALNPKYLIKLDFVNSLFLGEGFLTPMGSIGYGLAIWFFGIALFMFTAKGFSTHIFDSLIFVLFFCLTIVTKVAFFFPMLVFFGFFWIFKSFLLKEVNYKNIIILCVSFILSLFSYKLFFSNTGDMVIMKYHFGGFYFDYFVSKANQYGLPPNRLVVLLIIVYMSLIWTGLKLFVILFIKFNKTKIPSNYRIMLIASFFACLVSFVPGFLFHIFCIDEKGMILIDGSFDLAEFGRSGVFIFNVAFSGMIGLIVLTPNARFGWIYKTIILIWFCLVFFGFYSIQNTPQISWDRSKGSNWVSEVKKGFAELKPQPRLMAMISKEDFSCMTLVCHNVYPWWTYGKRAPRADYVMSNIGNYRANMVLNLIDTLTSLNDCRLIVRKIKQEGVDFLVATPEYDSRFNFLSRNSVLINSGVKWFYKLP
jgi:hypothetical protein